MMLQAWGVMALVGAGLAGGMLAWRLIRDSSGWLQRYREIFTAGARHRVDAFFLVFDPSRFWMLSLLTALSAGVTSYIWTTSIPLSLLLGALPLLLPRWLASWGWQRRQRRLDAQLPEILLGLAWALRGGASMQGALRAIVGESQPPALQEFGLLLREQRMGVTFEQALQHLYQRMPSQDMALVVAVMGVAAQSGGNLADALQRLSETVETRLRVQRRLRALTAQGVLQAWVMGALPIVLLLALQVLEPVAMQGLWDTPMGWMMLAVLGGLLVLGAWFIRRVVRVEA